MQAVVFKDSLYFIKLSKATNTKTINKTTLHKMGCGPAIQNSHQIDTPDDPHKGQTARCYLVTCMDFRLLHDVVNFMEAEGYAYNYDHFILAGSSLGYTQSKFPSWPEALNNHMDIGQRLHHFKEIIFIDHLDCGAYKTFYPAIKDGDDELQYHKCHMQQARDLLAKKYPRFRFRGYIMDMQGKCQRMQVEGPEIPHPSYKTIKDIKQTQKKIVSDNKIPVDSH